MPTYTYRCEKCDLTFEEFHSMSEVLEKCHKCNSSVERVVSKNINIKKNHNFSRKKPGNVVKQYIKDVKEEIKQEKKRILTQEYEIK